MLFALGFLTGIVIMGFIVLIVLIKRPAIERTINQAASTFQAKGKIIEPEPEEIKEWVDSLKTE